MYSVRNDQTGEIVYTTDNSKVAKRIRRKAAQHNPWVCYLLLETINGKNYIVDGLACWPK